MQAAGRDTIAQRTAEPVRLDHAGVEGVGDVVLGGDEAQVGVGALEAECQRPQLALGTGSGAVEQGRDIGRSAEASRFGG